MSEQREYTPEEIEAAINGVGVDDETPEPDAESTEHAHTEEDVEADGEPETTEEEPDAAEPEAEADEPEDEPEDDWQLKARQIQAAKDREIAAMQAEMQKLREEAAERRGREEAQRQYEEQSQSAEVGAVTLEDLQHGVQTNLAATFEWTVLNRPDMVSQLISMVRETEGYGHGVADQMHVEYNTYLQQQALAQQEERWQQLQQEREAKEAPLESQRAMEDVVEGLTERFGETFAAVQDEIAERLQTDGREYVEYLQSEAVKAGEDPSTVVTPELLREMMVDIYLEIREQSLNQHAAQPSMPAEVPAAAAAIGAHAYGQVAEDDNDFSDLLMGAQKADISVDPTFLP